MLLIAIGVTCPIMVLNAKLVIVASETPFDLVLVSKISAGIIPHRSVSIRWFQSDANSDSQDNGPFVAEKEKL